MEPRFYHEAINDANWREAMTKEIEALELNDLWAMVDLPPGRQPINCKWVYKVKYNTGGRIKRYKSRLVIQGLKQVECFDFNETFASITYMISVRYFLVVAIAAAKGWDLHQMDVNNTFLHGDLEEEVYMTLPLRFGRSYPNKVCQLQKSLFGLKQATIQ